MDGKPGISHQPEVSQHPEISHRPDEPLSPETSRNDQVGTSEEPVDETQQIKDLMANYELSFVEAVNTNDFSVVEPCLVAGSPLYKSQKALVSDLFTKGIKEEYVSHEVGYIYYEAEHTYTVEVIETIKIHYPDKGEVSKDFQWLYTARSTDGVMKLSELKKWESFEADMEIRMGRVKTGGYYADELIYCYGDVLVESINQIDLENLEYEFDHAAVREIHQNLVQDLRKRGKNFSLLDTEYLEDSWAETDNNEYSMRMKFSFQYDGPVAKGKKLAVTLKLTAQEHYRDSSLIFEGYALLTGMDDILIEEQ